MEYRIFYQVFGGTSGGTRWNKKTVSRSILKSTTRKKWNKREYPVPKVEQQITGLVPLK